jgi:hypothetical protein
MGNMVSKRIRKGIAKFNQAKARSARVPVKTATPVKTEVKGKK